MGLPAHFSEHRQLIDVTPVLRDVTPNLHLVAIGVWALPLASVVEIGMPTWLPWARLSWMVPEPLGVATRAAYSHLRRDHRLTAGCRRPPPATSK